MRLARFAVGLLALVVSPICMAGTSTLQWTAPTQNEDGTPLTDPSHYTIRAGCQQPGQYEEQTVGPIPWTQTSIVLSALPELVDCYFVATATNQSGVESAYSNEATNFIESTASLSGPVENLAVTWAETVTDYIEVPWTTQPPANTPIDWNNPITRQMAAVYVFDNLQAYNLVTGAIIAAEAGHDLSMTYVSGERAFTPNSNDVNNNFPVGDTMGAAGSIFVRAFTPLSTEYQASRWITFGDEAYNATGGYLGITSSFLAPGRTWEVEWTYELVGWNGGYTQFYTSSVDDYHNKFVNAAWAIENGSQDLIVNTPAGIIEANNTASYPWATGAMEIGGRSASDYNTLHGAISLVIKWDRYLSKAELLSITANPWQIFEPQLIPVFSSVAGGGAGLAISSLHRNQIKHILNR